MARYSLICGALIVSLLIFFGLSLSQGEVSIGFLQIIALLMSKLSWHMSISYQEIQAQIFWNLRLPVAWLVLLVGFGMGVSGAVLQSLLRNPLADPALLGVSSGAGLAVMLAMLLSLQLVLLPVVAFVGGMLTIATIYLFARCLNTSKMAGVLLSGIAINALCSAGMSLLWYFASDADLHFSLFWGMGGISNLDNKLVLLSSLLLLLGIAGLWWQSLALDVWRLGETEALTLGLDIKKLIAISLFGIALIVGVSVAIAGPIAFIGLVIPHVGRFLVGARHVRLLPVSGLLGACLLLFANWLGHSLFSPSIIPLGVMTAILGSPIFIALLFHYRHKL